ncbi:MAG TPA: hypothetical protein DCE56_04005, partial [Cyanobacteria bacterium UBA8553]|nr:hypothetical protein [Cyanobacteria bacterium UBA8553]
NVKFTKTGEQGRASNRSSIYLARQNAFNSNIGGDDGAFSAESAIANDLTSCWSEWSKTAQSNAASLGQNIPYSSAPFWLHTYHILEFLSIVLECFTDGDGNPL